MAESDLLRRYVEAGIALTQLTRTKAEAIVRELVKAGEVQRETAQDRVEELLDRSRKTTEGVVGLVRKEIAQQVAAMGFATKKELERLEARIDALSGPAPAAKAAPAKAAPAKAAGRKAAGAKAPASKAAGAPGTARTGGRRKAGPDNTAGAT